MKTKIPLTFLAIAIATATSFGQEDVIYHDGLYDLYKLLGENMKFPSNGPEGLVLLKFRIRDDHTIDSITVLNSLSPAIDKEAIRVIQLTNGNWRVIKTDFYLLPII